MKLQRVCTFLSLYVKGLFTSLHLFHNSYNLLLQCKPSCVTILIQMDKEGTKPMYKILIVEDDAAIAAAVENQLSRWGYETLCVSDFEHVLETFTSFDPGLVLLDISLPFYNGYYWCERIRSLSSVPIIFLSSAGDKMNIVMAMNIGADDFISKPFDLTVLCAKVQALIRRTYSFGVSTHLLERHGAILNLADATLTVQEAKIELTKNEFRILQLLMENGGSIVSRDTIMRRLWESDSFIDDNTLTVNMTRLRRKLSDAGLSEFIVTRKNAGYMIP